MFEVNNLSIKYPHQSSYLLSSVNFTIQNGETLWLRGPNGSGKTSLLYAICNVIPREIDAEREGDVILDNQILNDTPLNKLIPLISLVMANPNWELFFSNSQNEIVFSLENLGLNSSEIKKRITDAGLRFDLVNLMDFDSNKLSEGWKKLVVLAVHAAIRPRILLLDEPFNGLSQTHLEKVVDWLNDYLSSGGSLIIADHNEIVSALNPKILNLG
jgi:energy-coupling factor transporter ATP-binding protein EcfA2